MKPFDVGYEAFSKTERMSSGRKNITTNPFKQFGKQREWQRGYNQAYYDNLEKIDEH